MFVAKLVIVKSLLFQIDSSEKRRAAKWRKIETINQKIEGQRLQLAETQGRDFQDGYSKRSDKNREFF